jgi:UDPglucose--hexose-1-phosphate uridylyltransferase
VRSLARIMRHVLKRYAEVLDNPDCNLHIHSAPCDGLEHGYYHWHMHLAPKSVKFGSFEIGSGMYINSVPPERAAEILHNSGF